MIQPPTIVFDLDGTLVDTAPDLLNTLNAVLAPEGIGPVSSDVIIGYVGRGARVMLDRAHAAAGRPLAEETRERLFAAFLAHYNDHIADQSRPYAGAAEALDEFARSGWRLAVCTNKLEAPSKRLLDLLGLGARFAFISGQDTFGVAKPDPAHLTRTILASGGSVDRAVMVGDSITDIDTAIAAEVPVVAVSFGYSAEPVASLGATAVIDRFDELHETVERIAPHLVAR